MSAAARFVISAYAAVAMFIAFYGMFQTVDIARDEPHRRAWLIGLVWIGLALSWPALVATVIVCEVVDLIAAVMADGANKWRR